MSQNNNLEDIARLVRYYILKMTTRAGSGHPTSSLSATDLMVCLFFEKLRFDLKNPQNPANDRVIFSKGHVSPLIYALYASAGEISEKELNSYRQFGSPLEGHPTANFKFAECATGSLGQGLSIGVGFALAAKLDKLNYNTYVLMGDSETAEGSVWEAVEIASHYQLDNLISIIDVNRLGQSGPTMLQWDTQKYQERFESFGWETAVIDGHNLDEIRTAFKKLEAKNGKPKAVIAKTIKGKGVSFLENKEGWHGKALSAEQFLEAQKELGKIDTLLKGQILEPSSSTVSKETSKKGAKLPKYNKGEEVATRKAFGQTLLALGEASPSIVSLDAEVKNSTFSGLFQEKFPDRFFEMFIAEQNMVGAAIGLAKRGKVPFVSTFGVFLTRAFDQIRMAAYSRANIKFVGTHAGVSIGEDGPSQMALEDISMFRSVFSSTILCPADALACAKIIKLAAETPGIFYIRTNRPATPVIYTEDENFSLGGSKILRSGDNDKITIVSCGVTLLESLKAADELIKEGIPVKVIDAYSIKPLDEEGLKKAAQETDNKIITVEDHYFEGGLGDAVLNVFAQNDTKVQVFKLAVTKMPSSGKPEDLLNFEGISKAAIVAKVKEVINF